MSASVLIAGAGNIGSHLAPLLARAGVKRLRIIDRDVVEAKNLGNQDFCRRDVGRPKAEVLAERLREMNPGLGVAAVVGDLEQLPLGIFDVDLIFGGLDSRRARQALVSEIAWPLGKPVVDGGVGEGLLGRVQVFVPGEATACLECGWGEADYRRLVEEYPCEPGASFHAPSTLSPAFSGAVVAGLMAAEGMRLLAGSDSAESREIAFDLTHRRFLVSRLRRAAKCRFDHGVVREFLRLPRPFSEARGVDLVEVIESHFGSVAVQVESRHGLFGGEGFQVERFVTTQRLRVRGSEPLAALGLRSGDYLRVRSRGGSAFIVLSDK
jgi:molybdopterin/thiamine biosynthesis adenylyltransferase